MSLITSPVMLDSTGKDIAASLHRQNELLRAIAGESVTRLTTSMKEIQRIVRVGLAQEIFNIGDQIVVPWTNVATGTKYDVPMDVVHFGEVERQDGETVPGMYLQWHYLVPVEICFDAAEAELATESVFDGNLFYYTKSGSNYALETVTAGQSIPSDTEYYHNAVKVDTGEILRYGYNRWAHSSIRQWLNSDAGVGQWWTAQHVGDTAPAELGQTAGFLSGFDEDFLSVLTPIKVTTATNPVSEPDKTIGSEVTYDKFFLPSLEQMFVDPGSIKGEGEYWEYWKQAIGQSQRAKNNNVAYEGYITRDLEEPHSEKSTFLRTARTNSSRFMWYITPAGAMNGINANAKRNCAPACVIC